MGALPHGLVSMQETARWVKQQGKATDAQFPKASGSADRRHGTAAGGSRGANVFLLGISLPNHLLPHSSFPT